MRVKTSGIPVEKNKHIFKNAKNHQGIKNNRLPWEKRKKK